MTEVLLKPKNYGVNETYNIMCASRTNIQVWKSNRKAANESKLWSTHCKKIRFHSG